MIFGTQYNQTIKYSQKYGGVRRVFEGKPYLLVGGFDFNIEDLPTPGNVLPAGAPVNCDEEKRTITPIYTITAKEVSGNDVTVAKDSWGVPVKVGMVASTGGNITAVEDGEGTYKITFDTAPSATTGEVITIYPKSVGSTGIQANALLYCDICLDPRAVSARGDGVWFAEWPVLIRRTFPFTEDIKKQLAANGCFFRLSNRK